MLFSGVGALVCLTGSLQNIADRLQNIVDT